MSEQKIYYYYDTGELSVVEYIHGSILHRIDGPAEIEYYKSGKIEIEKYYFNGKKHNLNGPGAIYYKESGEIVIQCYFLFDMVYITFEEYDKERKLLLLK